MEYDLILFNDRLNLKFDLFLIMKQIDLLKHIQQNKIRYTEGIYCFVLDPRTIDLEEEVLYEYIEHFINTNLLVQLNEFTYILNF